MFFDFIRLTVILVIVFVLCMGVNAQIEPAKQPANATEAVLAQALQKALNEVEAARALQAANEKVIASQQDAIKSRDAVILMQERLIAAKDEELKRVLAIKCNETKWFWGIRKTKVCF